MFYILLAVIIASLLVIVFILLNKFIKIKQNPDIVKPQQNAHKERQLKIKNKLLERRLEKKIIQAKDKAAGLYVWLTERINKNLFKFKRQTGKRIIQRLGGLKTGVLKVKRQVPADDSVNGYLLEARTLLKRRKLDEAEDLLIKALQHDPKNIEAYMGLGKIYVARNDLDTAEEAYRYIVKIKPKFLDGYKELAKVFETVKKWSELRDLAEEILSLGYEQVWVYGYLGVAYRRLGYPEKAEEYFKRAVEIEPRNEKWLDYLIETAIINKNKNLAYKAFNTLTQISNNQMKLQGYRDKIDLL